MSKRKRTTRRDFLKGLAAATAAPYVLTTASLAADRSANDRINVACIGVRGRGRSLMGACLGTSGVQVVAVCDIDKEVRDSRLEQARKQYADQSKSGSFKGVVGCNDFREVMARGDIDAVTVATPDQTHALISIAACKSGKDVYVEKPMTLTIKDGRAMVDAVRRYNRVLQVGSQRRSSGSIRHMCELVRNGRYGRIERVLIGIGRRPGSPMPWEPEPVPPGFDYDLWLGPAPWSPYHNKRCHYNFRFVRDYSGGEMTNFGAHFFDVGQWGLGMDESGPVEIEGKGVRHPDGLYDVFYEVDLTYKYANGVIMNCTHSHQGVKFFGTEGDSGKKPKNDTIGPNDIHLRRAHGGHMADFLYCVRVREDPSANVETGHRTASICHLGNIAMDLGRKLKWDPVKEEFLGDDEANRLTWRPYRHPWRL